MGKEIQEAIKSLKTKMGDENIEGSIKFEIENVGSIVIEAGDVIESDVETDCTLRGDLETFMEIFCGDTSSTAAFMSGKLKIDGSMGTAMKYNTILS
jgi:putative sterol carrier protein